MPNQKYLVRSVFVIQAHITAECGSDCPGCYVKNASTYYQELHKAINYDSWAKVFADFRNFCTTYSMPGRVYFTGGDPLRFAKIFELINLVNSMGFEVMMMGNPDTITPKIARQLNEAGVKRFQLSLDGATAKTHDQLRGVLEHFEQTLKAVKILNKAGIQSSLMSTISTINADELVDMVELASDIETTMFNFARFVPFIKKDSKFLMTPLAYRKLLDDVYKAYEKQKARHSKTRFGFKDNLWTLYRLEEGRISHKDFPKDEIVYAGCPIGIIGLSILADGTVYSCRRLPIAIGKVPDQSIEEIFFNAPFQAEMRQIEKLEQCPKCNLLRFCRGCPAVAYAVHGSPFAPDPQCWKDIEDNEKT